MKKYVNHLIILLLLVFCTTALMGPQTALAASPLDGLAQTLTGGSPSFSLVNALLGLLLGNFLEKNNLVPAGGDKNTLAASAGPALPSAPGTAATPSAVIDTAKSLLGTPYVWGGETTAGFDCSSFTRYVMSRHGITLPRTAAEQYAVGQPVDRSNLQAGDLVFFTTYKPGPSHVGFYMGNDKFIHDSSAAKEVTISNLSDTYYSSRYLGARRYL